MKRLAELVGTFFFTGFFPFAPATFASAVFLALWWWVPGGRWLVHPIVAAVTAVLSVPVSGYLERFHGHDPSCVVIDEVVGLQVILLGAHVTAWGALAVFLLFRVFDVAKPFPVGRSQRLPGGWGVVVDDVLAGVYTRLVLVLVALATPALGTFL